MPELPEVETMRRGIAPIVGGRIVGVEQPPCRLRPIRIVPPFPAFRRRVKGRGIVSVSRVGKRVAVHLDSGDCVVFEPRMTGRILLAQPPDTDHLRLRFRLAGGAARELLFWSSRGLGAVQLLGPAEFAQTYGPDRLGPDALELSPEMLREHLQLSRRAIKVALMDQTAVAGIGNIYASEICHRARVHPAAACDRLRPATWIALHDAIGEILSEAIRLNGSTLADGNYRDAQNRAGSFQNEHRVYQRAGQRCLQCGRGVIRRIVQAQRSTFYCPACQRRRR